MNVLVLDNYDSFTGNLVQALEALGARCAVHRSDRIHVEQIAALRPDRIVLSPGPFGPARTGVCRAVIRRWSASIPILGVCLGMQTIAVTLGARAQPSGVPVHGKASRIWHDGRGVLAGMPNPFDGARYHSLIVPPDSVPPCLEVSAWTGDGIVMGLRLRDTRTEGVLFHPESFLTEAGPRVFANFLERC